MTTFLSFINTPRHLLDQGWQPWLRLALIMGVLSASAVLGYRLSPNRSILLLAFAAALAGSLILMRWPPLGLLILAVVGMVVRFIGPGGVNASVALAGLMLVLWLLDMIVRERQIKLVSSRTVLPLLVLVVAALLSFISGQFAWFDFAQNAPLDAQLGGLGIFVFSVAIFLLVANQVHDLRWLQAMTWLFLAFGTIFIAGRASPSVIGQMTSKLFTSGVFGGVFYAWFPALALGQALFNRKLHPGWRLFLIGLVLATIYASYIRNYTWKSGWMPSFAAIGVLIWLYSWRAGLLLTLLASIPAWSLVPDLLASDAYSVSTRFDAWLIMGEIIKVNPLLGLGFGNYYWYTPLFRIRGWEVTFNSHNNYVDIVAQTGLVGLLCFLWFFWEAGRLAWQLRNRVPEGFAQAYVNSALAGVVATIVSAMLGDWVLPFVYNIGLQGFRTGLLAWLFLGGLVVLEKHYANDAQSLKDKV
jgi:hypothetical protein